MIRKILFICTGNACRSVAAEYVLKKKLKAKGIDDIKVESAGTCDWGTNPRDNMMIRVAAERGYRLEGQTRYMTPELLNSADLVIVMEPMHRDKVFEMIDSSHRDRVHMFMEYCFGKPDSVLPDPHLGSELLYRSVFDIIVSGCDAIVSKIMQERW